MLTTRVWCAAFVLAAGVAASSSASAQSLGSLKKRAEEEAKKAKSAVEKKPSTDTVAKKPAAAPASASQEQPAPASAAPAPAASGSSDAAAAKPNAKVWENYDFVPGNKVIFYTDFSEDKVGNFARGLKYRGGSAEIVERNDTKVLRATSTAEFLVPVGKKLPERFTLEMDVIAPLSGVMNRALSFEGGAEQAGDDKSAWVTWNPQGAWIQGSGLDMNSGGAHVPEAMASAFAGNVTHIRVLMDGAYFKMYANERRMYNIPELAFRRDSVIRVSLGGGEEDAMAVYVTSIRVAESETDVLYDALAAKGRWVTQGILFATGKADVQPESRPVLKEIASTLKQHADLKIVIEGHTDNVGSSASNLALSDARAAAVKSTLVSDFGVDGSRITTKGLGDTKPSVPNTTSAGRA
ncbi:MAG TPA: OmpA family protein, partial [Gemmatimonadaceae bacterium]|nr:OmpA family protein [Gemmatimonadaceae bacterium]